MNRSEYNLYRDKCTLRWAYVEKSYSARDTGDVLGASKSTILAWLEKHNIERRAGPYRKGPWRDKDTLREEYVNNGCSINELSDRWDTSTATIHRWLGNHGIETRDASHPTGEDHWNYKGDNSGPEPRECPECGTKHTPTDGRVEYCSRECAHEAMKRRVSIQCEGCGETFKVARVRKDVAKFCSMECTRTRVEITCEQCGGAFKVRPSRSDRRFCSKECSQEWHTGENHPNRKERVERECATCGDGIEQPPWKAEQSERTFCDQECRVEWFSEWVSGRYTGEDHWMYGIDPEDHPMYAGGVFPYGPGFGDDKKEAVRERDNRECQHCGRGEEEHLEKYGCKHHVHHIQKARSFEDPKKRNEMGNLVTLCHGKCHATWERMSPLAPATD